MSPLDVSLALEQRRVAAEARLERLDVVRELALQVLRRFRPFEDQLAAPGAVEEAGPFAQDAVLGVDLGHRGCSHTHIVSLG
jgi:hypothetical protein